jgi:hypothetical protein
MMLNTWNEFLRTVPECKEKSDHPYESDDPVPRKRVECASSHWNRETIPWAFEPYDDEVTKVENVRAILRTAHPYHPVKAG